MPSPCEIHESQGKTKSFRSEAAANAFMNKLWRTAAKGNRPRRRMPPSRTYRCRQCGRWFLTSKPKIE